MTATLEPLATLPDVGRFIIDTADRVYTINLDTKSIERLCIDDEAAGRVAEPEAFYLDRVIECRVGEPFIFDGAPDYFDDFETITCSPVLGITAADLTEGNERDA